MSTIPLHLNIVNLPLALPIIRDCESATVRAKAWTGLDTRQLPSLLKHSSLCLVIGVPLDWTCLSSALVNKLGDKIRQGMLYLRLQSCWKAVQEELVKTVEV